MRPRQRFFQAVRHTDLSSISDAKARALLREFGSLVEKALKRYSRVELQGLGYDDLRAIAHVAVLEASISHDEERCKLRTWVYRTVCWRLARAVKDAQPDVELTDEPDKFRNGANPLEVLEKLESVMWVRQTIGVLGPRQRTIVVASMSGETLRQMAPTLGISKSRVGQERDKAYETLRERALEAGLDDE